MEHVLLFLLSWIILQVQHSRADSSKLQICEDGLVQVTGIAVVCDTPITWSYTRGSHRNSATCDYGDFANITVDFDIVDYYDNEIYMEMDAFSDQNEQLYHSSSKSLCGNFLGSEWSSKGSYTFTKRIQLDYYDGNATNFVPIVSIAFSGKENGGKELGGLNVGDCRTTGGADDAEEDAAVNEQSNKAHAIPRYGILAAIFAIALIGLVLAVKHLSSKKDEATTLLESENQKNEYNVTRTFSESTSSSNSKDKNASEGTQVDGPDLEEGYELMYDRDKVSDDKSSFSM